MLREGYIASSSSKILANYKASYTATAVSLLEKEGVVFMGRTNMDEFAMGSSTENSAYGLTKNPLDPTLVPGGSSGGSAASVAMHGALGALGSDTAGSIRQPAAFCGLVGFKPTYGAVSRYGLMAMASSLDEIGPLTQTVGDAEILFDALSHHDPMDATTTPEAMRVPPAQVHKKIGVPWAWVRSEGVSEEILTNFEASLEILKKQGYEIVDVICCTQNTRYRCTIFFSQQKCRATSRVLTVSGMVYEKVERPYKKCI
jgi:aspartyl-tRNA(Asn)/glutamyl-tRNA(Gln) amidotransferase subunit A